MKPILTIFFFYVSLASTCQLEKITSIKGHISPKSVVYNGNGLFFAQNMMYNHTITVYGNNHELIRTIRDDVDLDHWGYAGGIVKGAPVEVAFSDGGKYAWVSNYTMEGPAFSNPGCDNCSGKDFDPGYLYKINTQSLEIEAVIQAGAVPKFVACSPDNKLVLVSNWTSGDVTIISNRTNQPLRTIDIGRFPRGIVVDSKSEFAYITVMGSDKIAVLDLNDYSVSYIKSIGRAPRHLCISNDDKYLYASINNLGKLIKIDLKTRKVLGEVSTGKAPRSMVKTPDDKYLFVVNYNSNTISKVRTEDMVELCEVKTHEHPIGITLNWPQKEIWVACYSGAIDIFRDTSETNPSIPEITVQPDELFAVNSESLEEKENQFIESLTAIHDKHSTTESTPVENNYLENTYIVVGSFTVKSNAERLTEKLKGNGRAAAMMPSSQEGFTYVVIPVRSDPTKELRTIKQEVISSAWIYRP